MPAKKIVKKVSKKVVAKKTKVISKVSRSAEPHFLHKHISVTSPMGMILALAFLLAAAAVANAGYQAIKQQPLEINKVTTKEVGMLQRSLTGVISRDLRGEKGQPLYMLTTPEGMRYELLGVSERNLIEEKLEKEARMQKTPDPKSRQMTEAQMMAQNRRVMDKYIGKTVTVKGKLMSYGKETTEKGERMEKLMPKFVVSAIELAK